MIHRETRQFGRLASESGAVAVIVALLMVVLVGMTALVVDVGQMHLARRQMVNAADAAALAGAQELALGNAAGVAGLGSQYAIDNGSDPDLTVVEVDGSRVVASTGTNVEYGFARIFGLTDGDVKARAVALVGPVGAMEGLRPIAFREEEYQLALDDPDTELLGKHEVGSGNWGALDFDGLGTYKALFSNPNRFDDHLRDGWPRSVAIDDPNVFSNTGISMFKNKAPETAMLELEGQDIYVPIVSGSVTGTGWLEVVGFAKINVVDFVPADEVGPDGVKSKDPRLFIRFIETVVTGPDGFVDPTAVDFGLRTWDLVE